MPKRGDGGGASPAPVAPIKPPEEIITLDASSLEPPAEGAGKGKGKGKGKERPPEPKPRPHDMGAGLRKYSRGAPHAKKLSGGNDMKLSGKLKREARQNEEAILRLVKGEVLQTTESGSIKVEGPRERTEKLTQATLLEGATLGVAKKRFSFDLPYGPFTCGFTPNGQHILAGGRKGQVAMMHCDSMQICTELQLKETIRAVQPLHNQNIFAVAQKKYVYMYDNQGVEIHCLKTHKYITHMDFLPYHFLLVCAGDFADLHYRDISTGQEVSSFKTKLGECRSLRQNPKNAVMHMGHNNGTVTMWTPTVKAPVVKLACHSGHVTSIGVHSDYMVTSAADGYWKIWDLRKYEALHTFKSFGYAVSDVDVSMTGLLAVGFGSHLQIWKDAFTRQRPQTPYLREEFPGKTVGSVRFRPYEDVLGVGTSSGFGGLVVPGAGYANFDSFEANPFETKKQRQEREVRRLLDKLQPDTIMVDPNRIGSVDKQIVKEYMDEAKRKEEEAAKADAKLKKKMRGKNKVGNRQKRKHIKEGAEQRSKARERLNGEEGSSSGGESCDESGGEGDGKASAQQAPGASAPAPPPGTGAALGRFYGKRRRKT